MDLREFYPLDTLAARWRCTQNDIINLGGMGVAQVCANIYGLACGARHERLPEVIAGDMKNDMPDGIIELTSETLRLLELPQAFPYELEDGFRYFRRSWWEYTFDPPVLIRRGHLCVLRAEVLRLEAEVFQVARTELAPATTQGRPETQDQELKRAELIQRYASVWRSVERDLKDASTNELRNAAGGQRRGWWRENAALSWARARGKLQGHLASPSVFNMGRRTG